MTADGRVETVLGRRELPVGGLIDAHGHLWIAPPPGVPEDAPVLDREDAITEELGAFAAAGGAAVVDCQPPGAGRDVRVLARLAALTGLAVVAATGFHLRRWHGRGGGGAWSLGADAARAAFVAELRDGLVEDGTVLPARAGVVKAAHPGHSEPASDRLLAAAAGAAAEAGALLVVHTERGAAVEALAELLVGCGASPRRIMLCHVDKRPDLGLHRELAEAGFLLEYDTFLRPRYAPEANVWPLVDAMLAHGHDDAIACGLDLADASMWRFGGHPAGMAGLGSVVADGLRRRGATPSQVARLTGGTVHERLVRTRAAEAVA